MSGRDRPRGLPSNISPPNERRPMAEVHNGSGANPGPVGMSRAERFEDEKRRLIQSCFSKQDVDGSVLESYITHIRITEDAAFPSTPAPPNSPPENKKARVIIVSVRKSGRVRMHKARENNDGTFSIGKTWLLDDLSRIQIYEHMPVSSPAEQQQKMWASNIGFVVTVSKPYYWQAASLKEKDFFIGSLVKIYKKYTGGKVPELLGFDPRDRDMITGTVAPIPQNGPSSGSRAPPLGRPESPGPQTRSAQNQFNVPQPPYSANRLPSRDGAREHRLQASREQFLHTPPAQDEGQRPRPELPASKTSQQQGFRGELSPKPSGNNTLNNSHTPTPFHAGQPPRTRPPALSPAPNPLSSSTGNQPRTQFNIENGIRPARSPVSNDNGRPVESSKISTSESGAKIDSEVPKSRAVLLDSVQPSAPTPLGRPPMSTIGSSEVQSSKSEAEDRFVTPFTSEASLNLGARSLSRGSEKSTGVPESTSAQRHVPMSLRPCSGDVSSNTKSYTRSVNEPESVVRELSPDAAESPVMGEISDVPKILSSSIKPTTLTESPETAPTEGGEGETHRPGLGPMVKKKPAELASTLRKAATTYGAFKPRPGGAADRLLATKEKSGDEPDGITGVIPAPLSRTMTDDSIETTGPPSIESSTRDTQPFVPPMEAPKVQEVPKVQLAEPAPQPQPSKESPVPIDSTAGTTHSKVPPSQEERRRQRREDNTAQYCTALAIDPSLLEGRGGYFDDILSDLGWNGRLSEDKRIDDLEADVRREIGRVQASSWLGHLEQQEGKVDQLSKLFDKAIAECDELDGLLMLYAHELNTLVDDVAYIEAQSQGLQVQTANQKLLQNELQNLLKTISISSEDLRPLREASLSSAEGIEETESSLSLLYEAMVTIDPDIRINKKRLADAAGDRGAIGVYADTEVGQMRAVKEKTGEYRDETQLFLQRLKQYMGLSFKIAEQKTVDSIASSKSAKVFLGAHDAARQDLWMYNALMLFAREVSTADWTSITTQYGQQMKKPYQNEFRDNTMAWKREARKPTGDEQELLFTYQDKERDGEGITTAARKLTVRRGKTVRVAGTSRMPVVDKAGGKIEPYEVFGGSLEDTTKLIAEEQNFIVKFFHLTSLSNVEFQDLISAARPEDRRLPNLSGNESYDPDREMAKKVERIMEAIFSPWISDMQNLADWAIREDPLQGVGILFALERKRSVFDETSQEFIARSLHKIHSRFMGLFNRFVDEQIRAIEETKVKVNKRKGVISFMRIFPNFSASIENMISLPSQETFDIRFCVNDAYEKINRAMWDSLKFIAKEAPGQQSVASGGGQDPEDKEALNYHILLIENMNHYIEEVDSRDNIILTEWKDRAAHDLREHLRLYIDAVIRRPLGKLLDFIESTESLLQTAATPTDIALRTSHSRVVAKKLLTSYDTKELRRGIDALKKRIEKHFGDADDPGVSRSLVVKVLRECETQYSNIHDRVRHIIDLVYEGQMELEWRKEEAVAMFKR
ncbi:exocyst complex component Sec3 [Blastomyces dermatitidis ATCC 18188]|uniref:Exocyst complex component Sec3 n=1 Tax=Ajellomyces dermatitidis (strain ATCC 18188 / CBS 674.68) TaxID=653446 RepID=F2TQC5_AJEDA|nr:exocyst complex component Sec3 [Blastomyces dermatitidis ATCC 18188]